jgi:2'-5' RNA ligase
MRLFVGIPLADAVAREVGAVVERLRSGESAGRCDGLRWTELESWHITLQFLGNATEEQLECLKARLGKVRSEPVPVELGDLGCFERAGVFFADVMVTPELNALERSVVAATGQCGFVAETRTFHPHITLARMAGTKGPRDQGNKNTGSHARAEKMSRGGTLRDLLIRAGRQPAFTRFTAREFVLYESHLGPGGARYEAQMRVELGDGRDPMAGGND